MDKVTAGKVSSHLTLPGPMVPLGLKTHKEKSSKRTSGELEKKKISPSNSRKSPNAKSTQIEDGAISPVPKRIENPPLRPTLNLKENMSTHKEGGEVIHRHVSQYVRQNPQLEYKQSNHMRAALNGHGLQEALPKSDEGLGAKLRSAIQKCQCIAQSYNFLPGRGGNEKTGDDGDVRRPTDLRFEGGTDNCQRCGHDHTKIPASNQNYGDDVFKHTALYQTDRYDHHLNCLGDTDQTSPTPLVFWKRSRQGNFGLLTAIGPDGRKYGLRIPLPTRGEGTASLKQENNAAVSTVLKPSSLFRVVSSPSEDSRALVVMVIMFFMLTVLTYVYRTESS